MTVTKTKTCFKGCEKPGEPRRLQGMTSGWYEVEPELAQRVVYLCDSCFKPASPDPGFRAVEERD